MSFTLYPTRKQRLQRSYLAVPVMSRNGDVLGGLFFGHATPGVFDERSPETAVSS